MVIDGECSLLELKSEAAKRKQMKALRTIFLRLTNTESREMAQELYPQFANEQQLGRLTCKNLSHNLSVIFVSEQKKRCLAKVQTVTNHRLFVTSLLLFW